MSFDAVPQDPDQVPTDASTSPQILPIDLDGDGVLEGEFTLVDGDGDGVIDTALGRIEHLGDFAIVDLDADTNPDLTQLDTTGDGLVDTVIERTATGYLISVDVDGDGVVDQQEEVTAAELSLRSPALYALLAEAPVPTESETLQISDGAIVGDPFRYGDEWFEQAFNGACLPASAAVVIEEYLGREVSEAEIIGLVNELGGWVVGADGIPGMMPESMVGLLEHYGIDARLQENTSLDDLMRSLDDGYAVAVAVDSGYIWAPDGEIMPQLDHMLLVAGIDTETGIVYLSDSGTKAGNVEEVPLATFLAAWAGSANAMVVSEVTVEEFAAGGVEAPIAEEPQEVDILAEPQPDLADTTSAQDPSLSSGAIGDAGTIDGIDLSDLVPTPLEQVMHTLTRAPWIILPLVIGAGAALSAVVSRKTGA